MFQYPELNSNYTPSGAPDAFDSSNQLDLLGNNHTGNTNFVYGDGHGERKKVITTVQSCEWGDRFYSLNGTPNIRPFK
jgi:prepilin-type processing-associated H-X9-DG protein